jgi:hypothetical protein
MLQSTLTVETVMTSETLVDLYQTAGWKLPEDTPSSYWPPYEPKISPLIYILISHWKAGFTLHKTDKSIALVGAQLARTRIRAVLFRISRSDRSSSCGISTYNADMLLSGGTYCWRACVADMTSRYDGRGRSLFHSRLAINTLVAFTIKAFSTRFSFKPICFPLFP